MIITGGVLFTVLAVFLGFLFFYLYSRTDGTTKQLQKLGFVPIPPQPALPADLKRLSNEEPPNLLTVNFNPTQSPVTFRVESIQSGYFSLAGMSPPSWAGRFVTARKS